MYTVSDDDDDDDDDDDKTALCLVAYERSRFIASRKQLGVFSVRSLAIYAHLLSSPKRAPSQCSTTFASCHAEKSARHFRRQHYRKTSISISSVLVGNGRSNFCRTLGCRMPKVPMRVSVLSCSLLLEVEGSERWMDAAWPGR